MDVKDVKQGLACCGQDHMDEDEYFYVQDCEECPWKSMWDARHEHCAVAMMREARETIESLEKRIAELEKAQEPRVMTLEEVLAHYSLPPVVLDDLGWQENYLQDIEPLYFDFPVEDSWAVHWRGYQQVRKYLEDWRASYGQNWRCWTSRPTDEQREAEKWA